MIALAKVISTKLADACRWVKVTVFGDKDTREVDEVMPFGIDGNAPKDMIAAFAETTARDEPVILGYINVNQKARTGELRLYSTDSGDPKTEKIYLYLRNNGNMEIGGDADNMVRYSKLEEAYNQLKSDHDDLVSLFNSHIHTTTATVGATAVVGVISPPSNGTGSPSTGDITPAKIDEIKTL